MNTVPSSQTNSAPLNSSQNISSQPLGDNSSQTITQQYTNSNTGSEAANKSPVNLFDFKNLRWYEWLGAFPAFILLISGGAIGGLFGALGWMWTLKIIRKEGLSKAAKVSMVIGVTILYWLLYLIVGSFLVGLIEGLMGA